MIKAAFSNWPEGHEFQPRDSDHLRRWLQCKAGHYSTQRIDVDSDDPSILKLVKIATQAAFDAAKADAWCKVFDKTIVVFSPLSIAFDKLGHNAACALLADVEAIIETELGVKSDDLLREAA